MDTYEQYTVYVSREAIPQTQKKLAWSEVRHRLIHSNKPFLLLGITSVLTGLTYFMAPLYSSEDETIVLFQIFLWGIVSYGLFCLSYKDVAAYGHTGDEPKKTNAKNTPKSQDDIQIEAIDKRVQEKQVLEEEINQRKLETIKLVNITKTPFEFGRETDGLLKLLSDGHHEIFQEIKNITLIAEKGESRERCDKAFFILARHHKTGKKSITETIPPQNNWRSGIKPSYFKAVCYNYDTFNACLQWLSSKS